MKIVKLNNYFNSLNQKNQKIKLLKMWLTKPDIFKILKKHNVNFDLFVKKYALSIVNHFTNFDEKLILENIERVDDFVKYLKEHDILLVELFNICNGLKETFIDYFYEEDLFELQIVKEINYIYEKSFSNILNKYTQVNKKIENKLIRKDDIIDKFIIMTKYDLEGKVIDVSSAFCDISGYTKEEIIGKSFREIKHPDLDEDTLKDIEKSMQNGKTWHGEMKNKDKFDATYWVDATFTPVYDEKGNVLYIDSIRQDITTKKELEEQQSILIEQSKSAAIGEMISMIAHQWRQPLQAVSILIQKLPLTKMQDGNISDELLSQVVENVTSQLEYMSKTIDDFRDYFLPDKPKEKIFIKDLIEKTMDFLGFMLKNDGIKIETIIKDNISLEIYVNEIIQVFISIIKNARDVLVEKSIKNSQIIIEAYKDNSFLNISIEDNAGGIPNKIINKVFEPYFSTKDNKNGTGLGLYMCKTIIEKQSLGSLSVENTDLGAKFIIKLPIS
ncbi:PAS domain-containing sensor histidine kinase [Halarcobacter sp.]|uniref:PAS domain-containing sensor histidine kinase n=1 Tax=Halarcobacter sp. TaxID=2321133 RepID=UPI002AAC3AFA|nr:PAS domain-containing sensor histidine kinase [Halarcobacter sp.]